MKKRAYQYVESDEEDTSGTASTVTIQKKKKISTGSLKNYVKSKFHGKKTPYETDCTRYTYRTRFDEPEYRVRSRSIPKVRYKLPSIVRKYEKESSEESDSEPPPVILAKARRGARDRYLVGRVPTPDGKPGMGGGVAIYVKNKKAENKPGSSFSTKKKLKKEDTALLSSLRRSRKRSI